MSKLSLMLVVLLFLGFLSLMSTVGPASAAGETYSLSLSTTRTQEGNSSGVTLSLHVDNAVTPTVYAFVWTVTDPAGSSNSAIKSSFSTQPSWWLSVNYPVNFTGASLSTVGVYLVRVNQTSPSTVGNVATGQFQVGLTDSSFYQRTYPVSVKASGYLPADNVTINVSQGVSSAPGFPTSRAADATGMISLVWQTSPGTLTGNYVVTVSGKNTSPKVPPDTQSFTVFPTNITVQQLWLSQASLQRSQTIELRFNGTYARGLPFTSGLSALRLVEPDGVTSHSLAPSYDPVSQTFRALYNVPLTVQSGAWVATIDANSLWDPYGNGGPSQATVQSFSVLPALLNVSIVNPSKAFTVGDTVPIYAAVASPDGTRFTLGAATASLTFSGRSIGGPIQLAYDQTRGEWFGGHQVGPADPSGAWLVQVNAYDTYGNSGSSSSSYTVNVPPTQNLTSSWLLWLAVLAVVASSCVILITRHRGVSRREVKLDIQAIKRQADQVKSDDFLQSIQSQLKRHAERESAKKADGESGK